MNPLPQETRPAVTVLMAVHDGAPYVEQALRSVMVQTLTDIEILVVDDASTDETPEILTRLAAEDGRIRIERLKENVRLPRALNHGLALARGMLIARMDADDVCAPNRLEVQARFMAAHSRVVLVGASIREIDKDGRVLKTSVRPRHAYGVRWISRFYSPVMHPTFMFRGRLPDGTRPFYDPTYSVSEDYDFLVRIQAHGDVVNLPDVLIDYRMHGSSVSHRNWKLQQEQSKEIALRHMRRELPDDIVAGLQGVIAAFLDMRPTSPGAMFSGLRHMTAYDLARAPAERAWVRQNVAKLARQAMVRAGLGQGAILRAFLGPGREFLPDMALRALEAKLGLRTALRDGVWAEPDASTTVMTRDRP